MNLTKVNQEVIRNGDTFEFSKFIDHAEEMCLKPCVSTCILTLTYCEGYF